MRQQFFEVVYDAIPFERKILDAEKQVARLTNAAGDAHVLISFGIEKGQHGRFTFWRIRVDHIGAQLQG